ncbi:ABC transporter ATP-binding protein [Shouchella lehensis]|uniref:ABC transporter ATP-binding protein n=1 Tax=Shouchella lehensis TaxID=300825 RepID=A0A4Y7WL49_9BACI|nr:ABC transporter ATP-binding protein [Shouchella lehensis]MBG9783381.1 multidrug ABC transporter permease [Shouchella lehensis]TES49232.1 ABC transporter ATP-binding protein [Shouchella lehensis]
MEEKQHQSINIKAFIAMIRPFLPRKLLLLLAVVLVVFETALALIVPLLTMNFIDEMTVIGFEWSTIALLGVVFLAQLIMSGIAIYTMVYIGQKVVYSLRETAWKRILHLPVSFFDRHSSGEMMSRMTNDTLVIKDFMTMQLIPFISGLISIIGSIIILFVLDWKITLMMLAVVPASLLVMMPLGRKMYRVSRSLQDETASFQGDLGRVLADIRLVKASLAEDQEKQVGIKRMANLFGFGLREGKIMAVIQPIMMSLMLIMLVVIFGYGGMRVAANTLTAGALVAIIFYLFQISVPFTQMANFFTQLQKALGASERMETILHAEVEQDSLETMNTVNKLDALAFQDVSFQYAEDKKILQHVDFTARVGEMTAFVGPSGAGKTTLFSLIERFYLPTSGTIQYRGVPTASIPLNKWREKIAYVSQDSPIMSGTIRSNLTYGLENVPNETVEEAVHAANLKQFLDGLSDGLETEVGERGVRLSGGQKQRLAIARAMIRNPEILLLDEATAHLDSASEKLVQEALERLMSGRTTLVIAHRLATVRNADQLIVLEGGRVTGSGTHQELLENHGLYQELVKQQLHVD